MFNFLHTFSPDPILLKIGWLTIHWYGFLIVIGACLGLLAILHLGKLYGLKKELILDLTFYLIIFGLIGDRLYYVAYAWEYYAHNLLDIFKIWEGGLAIHGAIIAGILVVYIFAKKHQLNTWLLTDLVVVALALAMAVGRFGNYFNMELFGLPTNLPWGIFISPDKRPLEFMANSYFHPTFLYESLWNIFIFSSLFIWHKVRLAKNKNTPDKIKGIGNITLAYLMLYSVGRFMNEFLRIDYSPYVFNIRWAQIASLIILIICLGIIIYKGYRRFKQPG